jgi:hypothetical protein
VIAGVSRAPARQFAGAVGESWPVPASDEAPLAALGQRRWTNPSPAKMRTSERKFKRTGLDRRLDSHAAMAYCAFRMRCAVKCGRFLGFLLLVRCSDGTPPGGPSVTDSGADIPNPTYTIEQLKDPSTCQQCHAKHYRDWSGSMHAYAAEDPLFLAMNERGQRDANIGNFCVNCHAPMAVAAAPKDTVITSAMLMSKTLPASQRGITCYFCHNIDDVTDSHNNPLHLAGDNVMRGRFTDAVPNEAHASAYSKFLDGVQLPSAHACGSCHDIVNGHEAHIERTFEEWQGSVFSSPAGGQTCAQCHLSRSINPELIADGPKAPGVFARYAHDHKMAAVDRALTDFPEIEAQKTMVANELDEELQTALCVASFGTEAKIAILTANVRAGHRFPSGASQDRQLWFEVTAYAGDKVVYQSGAVKPDVDPKDMPDDDLWLIRDCMFDEKGNQTHNFWDAKTYDFNSLPLQTTLNQQDPDFYKSHVARIFPKPASMLTIKPFPDRATLKVWLQPFPYSVFDDHEKELSALGYTDMQIKSFRAKLAPVQMSATGSDPMGRDLVWTSEIANDPMRGGSAFHNNLIPGLPQKVWTECVSLTAMKTQTQLISAPTHTTCQP